MPLNCMLLLFFIQGSHVFLFLKVPFEIKKLLYKLLPLSKGEIFLYFLNTIKNRMARTKTRIYSGSKERTMESMVEVTKTTLEDLGMSVTVQYLDRTLIECIGVSAPGSPIGKNTVTVYKEGDQIFIKLTYQMPDGEMFWDAFEMNLQIYGASIEEIEEKTKVVTKICETIRDMQGEIEEEVAWDFLYNFERNAQRLPREDEIPLIADSYLQANRDKTEIKEDESAFIEEQQGSVDIVDDGIVVTKTDALKQMIKEIPTLDDDSRYEYLKLIDTLEFDDQKRLLAKIQQVEADLEKVPYLSSEERKDLRNKVKTLNVNKRRDLLFKEIKNREKNKAYYENKMYESLAKEGLDSLIFLDYNEKRQIEDLLQTLIGEEKLKLIDRIRTIEERLDSLAKQEVELNEQEKKFYRQDLIRLTPEEREEKISQIMEKKKAELVKQELLKTIPQLAFQDNTQIIKRLMWLNKTERINELQKMAKDIESQVREKQQEFEKHKAGKVCQKCGWPMGQFTKKCPQCGWKETSWLDNL